MKIGQGKTFTLQELKTAAIDVRRAKGPHWKLIHFYLDKEIRRRQGAAKNPGRARINGDNGDEKKREQWREASARYQANKRKTDAIQARKPKTA